MANVKKEIAIEVSMADKTTAGTESAKSRLKALREEMIQLASAGQQNTDRFRQLESEAGELADTIADTSQRIKNVGSDTRNIEAFTQAVQGLAAGFQIAQGAAGLFGEENEDVQKAILKVQSAMAIANGVQQIANLLQKESAISITANRIATALYDKTLKGTIVSLRLFRTALISTGIGAAIVGVGLLAENWDRLTAAVKGFFGIETKDLKAVSELAQRQVELAEARGESEAKVQKLLMDAYDARIAAAEKEEERAQLRHEKEVARLTYQTKLRTEKDAKEKEAAEKRAEKLKELDEAALATTEEVMLARANSYKDESEREAAVLKEKLDSLELQEEKEKAAILTQFKNESEREEALKRLKEKYRNLNQLLSEESAKKQDEISAKNAETVKQYEQAAFDAANELSQAKIARIENESEKERLLAENKKMILAKEYEDRKLQAQTEITDKTTLNQALLLLNQQFLDQQAAQDEAYAEKKKQLKINERDTTIKFANEAFTGILGLGEAMMGTSEEDARKAFNLNKAASIADATVNTFLAATQALRDPKLPTVAKAFAVGGIIASGLAQVRKIAATQFKASGSSGGGGGGGTGATGQAAPQPSEIFANPQTTNLGTGELSAGQGQNTAPTRAYVVERDITQSTRRVRRLEEFATIGG